MGFKPEPALWSRDTGQRIFMTAVNQNIIWIYAVIQDGMTCYFWMAAMLCDVVVVALVARACDPCR